MSKVCDLLAHESVSILAIVASIFAASFQLKASTTIFWFVFSDEIIFYHEFLPSGSPRLQLLLGLEEVIITKNFAPNRWNLHTIGECTTTSNHFPYAEYFCSTEFNFRLWKAMACPSCTNTPSIFFCQMHLYSHKKASWYQVVLGSLKLQHPLFLERGLTTLVELITLTSQLCIAIPIYQERVMKTPCMNCMWN